MLRKYSAYITFTLLCLVIAGRDVVAELLFKGTEKVSPQMTLFISSFVTQIGAYFILRQGKGAKTFLVRSKVHKKNLALLSLFTFLSFFFYFKGISTMLGAALTSFIDYGLFPFFTAIFAFFLVNEKNKVQKFASALLISVLGIALFLSNHGSLQFKGDYSLGLFFAVGGAIFSGLWAVYLKKVLQAGFSRSETVFARMTLTTAFTLLMSISEFSTVKSGQYFYLIVMGVLGSFIPMILTADVAKKMTSRSFALLCCLIPIFTFIISAIVLNKTVMGLDVVAAAMVLGAALYFES
jgi:drug/metabolite transporter (DMT)-like permease